MYLLINLIIKYLRHWTSYETRRNPTVHSFCRFHKPSQTICSLAATNDWSTVACLTSTSTSSQAMLKFCTINNTTFSYLKQRLKHTESCFNFVLQNEHPCLKPARLCSSINGNFTDIILAHDSGEKEHKMVITCLFASASLQNNRTDKQATAANKHDKTQTLKEHEGNNAVKRL